MSGTLALLSLVFGDTERVRSSPVLNEMAEAQKACGIDGVSYVQFDDKRRDVYVLIASRTYSRKADAQVASSIDCSAKVAADQGYKPIVLGTEN